MENRESTTPNALQRQQQGGLARSGAGSVARYNPLHEMQEQIRRMDALFNRIFGYEPFPSFVGNELQQLARNEPDVDVYESDGEYLFHIALPGIDPGNIQLEATEDTLSLTAQRRSPFAGGTPSSAGAAPSADNTNPDFGNRTPGNSPTAQNGGQQTRPSPEQGGASSGAPGGQPAGQTSPPAAGPAGPADAQNTAPHTQHRKSRHSGQSRLRLVYTLPTPIDPDNVRADFNHGMLELHLPKQRQAGARSVPISVTTGAGASRPAIAPTPGTPTAAGTAGSHEGNPASKMGSSYIPSAGEDHTTQAQSVQAQSVQAQPVGARAEHEPGREANAVAAGQSNPQGASSSLSGAPTEAGRS